jgi:hypothetical protein
LAESIRQLGLLQPISITHTHRLIAGLHRLEACKLLGWKTIPVQVLRVSDTEAQLLECDENLIRNDLTVMEKADHYLRRKTLYEELHPETRNGGWRGNGHTGGLRTRTTYLSFCLDAGNKTHCSIRTVQRLVQIAKLLCPEAKRLLLNTEWATNQMKLTKLAKLPHDLQISVAQKVANGEAQLLNDAVAKVHQERFRAKACRLPVEGADYKLLCGDFRRVGHEVPSDSVKLLICDAPYETQYLDVFQPLSLFSRRVLKPGGSLLCMVGSYHLPRILNDLSEYLDYQWVIATTFNGMTAFIPNRYVRCSWKPFVWFVNPPYRGKAIRDLIHTGEVDKRFHPHGQSTYEFGKLIGWFTKPGDTVMDCFLGGGTCAVAALSQHRRFIGIDLQKKHIETTRRRIDAVINGKEPIAARSE